MKHTRYSLAWALLAVIIGCQDESGTELPQPKEGQPIEIRAFLKEGDKIIPFSEWNKTRATPGDLSTGFRIYAIAGTEKWTSKTPAGKYIWNDVLVKPDGTIDGGDKMWLSDGSTYHHFGGYGELPTMESGFGWINPLTADGAREFKQKAAPSKCVDLLVAEPIMNVVVSSSAPVVNLYFKHALSRIVFKLYGSGATPFYNLTGTISSKASIIVSRCHVPIFDRVTPYTGKWEELDFPLTKGPLTLSATHKDKANAILLGDVIYPPTTAIYPEDWIVVNLKYDLGDGIEQEVSVGLPPTKGLAEGMQYTYYINHVVDSEALTVSDVEVSDWTTDERLVDELK